MTEYRHTVSTSGDSYEKREGTGWVPIDHDEAKAAGVWADPRGMQYGVTDNMATPEQLASRDKGAYDPREASGSLVAKRLTLVCGRCDADLGEVVEFERRYLFHSLRTREWTLAVAGIKCKSCFEPLEFFGIDMELVSREVEKARAAGRARRLRVGSVPGRFLPN